jgi:putative FmdB family regulatory protein
MPTYEYLCASCKETFYLVADKPPKPNPNCPNCGSEKTMREWNAPNIIFKGDGFYTTDNKDKKKDEPT